MKNIIVLLATLAMITGCDYTEQERKQFQADCMLEHKTDIKNKFDQMAVTCACKNWSLRKDIIPKDKGTLIQYMEEQQKCYSIKIKDDYKWRQDFVENCQKYFLEVYPSFAEQWVKDSGGWGIYDVLSVGPYRPDIFERGSNKELVDCACLRLSTRDDFTLPRSIETLKKEFAKESKTCQKDNKRSKK